MMWSATTKRLLAVVDPGEQMLAMVAFYLSIKDAVLLVQGKPDVPHDEQARRTCPIPPRELRKLRDRLALFRHEVLHLSDKSLDEERYIRTSWRSAEPQFTYESSVGKDNLAWDKITRHEVEQTLEVLDPWLHDQWERIAAGLVEMDADTLRTKIESVMIALSRELSEGNLPRDATDTL